MTIFPFSAHIMSQPLPMGLVEMDQEQQPTLLYLSKQQKYDNLLDSLDDDEHHTSKNYIYQAAAKEVVPKKSKNFHKLGKRFISHTQC